MRVCALLILGLAALGVAQEPTPKENRLVFPPGSTVPLAPTPVVPAQNQPDNPTNALNAFFNSLKIDKIDDAYDALLKGTTIADRPEEVKNLKEHTRQALDDYGPISGYEVIEDQKVGSYLMRRTCLSLNADLPLRWRFYFYGRDGAWRLIDLRIDNGLVELFDDMARKRP